MALKTTRLLSAFEGILAPGDEGAGGARFLKTPAPQKLL